MGVEGGMYIVEAGIKKENRERIAEGWDMLQRNIHKVSSLVKDFLSFAKGRKPAVKMVDPNAIVDDIINLYSQTARKLGVKLVRAPKNSVEPAPLDPEGIHTCLTNLVSNAIDTCQTSQKTDSRVIIDVYNKNGMLIIEVSDNGAGIDYEIQKSIFTTFFTTKGGKGTGLGLLTTNKIIQEHGGKILMESKPEKGTTFKIELPREQLLKLHL
jgi:signal transduction histidine kinase